MAMLGEPTVTEATDSAPMEDDRRYRQRRHEQPLDERSTRYPEPGESEGRRRAHGTGQQSDEHSDEQAQLEGFHIRLRGERIDVPVEGEPARRTGEESVLVYGGTRHDDERQAHVGGDEHHE